MSILNRNNNKKKKHWQNPKLHQNLAKANIHVIRQSATNEAMKKKTATFICFISVSLRFHFGNEIILDGKLCANRPRKKKNDSKFFNGKKNPGSLRAHSMPKTPSENDSKLWKHLLHTQFTLAFFGSIMTQNRRAKVHRVVDERRRRWLC